MIKLKYKVGDRVRIKDIDWYKNNRDLYGHIVFPREDEEDVEFDSLHADYCGQIMTIRSIVYGSRYVMEDDIHESEWTDEMIEGLVEEKQTPKMVHVETVKEWLYTNFFEYEDNSYFGGGYVKLESVFDTFEEMIESFNRTVEE